MTWIKRMEHALADDRFVLFAQPIVDVTTREVAQHELLLRMLGDDNEPIAPAAFLSVAERFDMIRDIDRFVVGRAIDLLAKHEHAGHPVDLAVNVSGKSLAGPELLEFVRRRMAETGASGSGLTFEITETAAVANIQLARRFVEGLHDLGCKLALDDFGSGFGSFYYLKHLPFDSLKIDGEFVAHCLQNSTDRLVIDSVVRIAHGLGKQTVAEFTTDEATFEFLREKRVDFAQGYHLGKPEPVEQALTFDGPLVA
jgi:EAL domain-containing protein (putative c-di-GMP-specific phosphodiesterase class I)